VVMQMWADSFRGSHAYFTKGAANHIEQPPSRQVIEDELEEMEEVLEEVLETPAWQAPRSTGPLTVQVILGEAQLAVRCKPDDSVSALRNEIGRAASEELGLSVYVTTLLMDKPNAPASVLMSFHEVEAVGIQDGAVLTAHFFEQGPGAAFAAWPGQHPNGTSAIHSRVHAPVLNLQTRVPSKHQPIAPILDRSPLRGPVQTHSPRTTTTPQINNKKLHISSHLPGTGLMSIPAMSKGLEVGRSSPARQRPASQEIARERIPAKAAPVAKEEEKEESTGGVLEFVSDVVEDVTDAVVDAADAVVDATGGIFGGEEAPDSPPVEDTRSEEVKALSVRAQKKWSQLDVDDNGYLDGEEALALAEWVWCSFRPGQAITAQQREMEAQKIMSRCDVDRNGVIDRGEFQRYYDQIAADMFRFHKTKSSNQASHISFDQEAAAMLREVEAHKKQERVEAELERLEEAVEEDVLEAEAWAENIEEEEAMEEDEEEDEEDRLPAAAYQPFSPPPATEKNQMPKRPVAFEGWLWKKGKGESLLGRRNWTKRHFRLYGGYMSYAKEERSPHIQTLPIFDPTAPCMTTTDGSGRKFTRVRQVPCNTKHPDLSDTTMEVAFTERVVKLRADDSSVLDKWEAGLTQHLEYYSNPTVRKMIEEKQAKVSNKEAARSF